MKGEFQNFIALLLQAMQYNENPVSITPSIICLLTFMICLKKIFHGSFNLTRKPFVNRMLEDFLCHMLFLIYFLFWFIVIGVYRVVNLNIIENAEENNSYATALFSRAVLFMLFFSCSMLPTILLICDYTGPLDRNNVIRRFFSRQIISELGTEGQMLHMPRAGIQFTKPTVEPSFRVKRSTSWEILQRRPIKLQTSRSAPT